MELKQKTVAGIKWSAANQIVVQLITITTSIILGRYFLSPQEYGVMGMITVFTGFAHVIKDFGISAAIIQKKQLSENILSTAFWLNVLIGILIALVFVVFAPFIAAFYNEAILKPLSYFVAFQFFFSTFTIVQLALLTREMRFNLIFRFNALSLIIASAVAMFMAARGWGIWSLVAQQMVNTLVLNVCLWFQATWKPKWLFDKPSFSELLGYSGYLFLSTSINYWNKNIDNLMIGKWVGSYALGNYSRAYMLMMTPTTQIVMMLGKVLFPALSKLQDDLPKVKQIFLRSLAIIALGTFPLSVGLWVVADDLIIFLLGNKWAEVIPIFKIFVWAGLIRTMTSPSGNLWYALGKTNIEFRVTLISTLIGISCMVVGLHLNGVDGVATGVLLWSFFALILNFIVLHRYLKLSPLSFLSNIAGVALATLLMGSAAFGIKLYVLSDMPLFIRLFGTILSGGLVFGLCVYFFRIKAFWDAYGLMKGK